MYEEENINPEFMKRGKTNPFRTPDRYFDTLEDNTVTVRDRDTMEQTRLPIAELAEFLRQNIK